jgi:hypothetical protein
VPDVDTPKDHIENLYNISRQKYNRSLAEAKEEVITKQKDVVEKLSDFSEPII